ncbi:UDP-N-acetylmuramoyl-tripeptide--D-alanyl-D-alanine ligase [Balneolaceae bacterium ANBcel3]|nr:UDP-N-acetylmuramoyl-tripeptide--D-alanyl-D-alanine ligase [Balneolaceae bacterium ANBcel3]
MNWYYVVIELLCWLLVFVMLRHMFYRGMSLVHIFQQSGYKVNELIQWLARHWSEVLIPMSHLGLVLLTLSIFYFFSDTLTTTAITLILIVFCISWFWDVSQYKRDKVKKPLVLTPRAIRLSIGFAFLSALIPITGTWVAFEQGALFPVISLLVFSWVFGSLFLPYLLILTAILLLPLEKWIQFRFKQQARKKIASMPELKVVAITGSYGKTSTKFLVSAILEERYRVCTTPGSYNTPMGICKVINQDLKPGDQVLVLEMGARYKGNIDELCRIAQPDIAVVTNVGIAHLESFGSKEAIAQTKAAIVRHLKPGGIAVLNGDDAEVVKMTGRDDIKYVKAGLSSEENDLVGSDITYDEKGCRFIMTRKDSMPVLKDIEGGLQTNLFQDKSEEVSQGQMEGKTEVTMSLLGKHSVQNALLAASASFALGIRPETVRVALQKVKPVEHRLELKKNNGVLVIDDAFNSNPIGAKNAISVLMSFSGGRKFVVTPGMIELGERQEQENRMFGMWMAEKNPDHIYLVGLLQTKPILEGLMLGNFDEERVTTVSSLFEANSLLQQELKAGDVVLYENDLPDSYNENP